MMLSKVEWWCLLVLAGDKDDVGDSCQLFVKDTVHT